MSSAHSKKVSVSEKSGQGSDDTDSATGTGNVTKKEIQRLSKVVKQKLENYFNVECREKRFNPRGAFTTNGRMADYDMAYKVFESVVLDKPLKCKKNEESKRSASSRENSVITPRLITNSRRVTNRKDAERISQNANTLFESLPLSRLNTIHRYRPHPKNDAEHTTVNGKIQNYSRHVGVALHSQTYVDYYIKEGLQTGSKEKSERLKKIKAKPEKDSEEDKKEKEGEKTKHEKSKPKETTKSKHSKTQEQAEKSQKTTPRSKSSTGGGRKTSEDFRKQKEETEENSEGKTTKEEGSQSTLNYRDDYSDDFENDDEDDGKSQHSMSYKPVDSQSIHTYVSVEHAFDEQ